MECPNCCKNDEHNSRFCMNCGQPLKTDAAPELVVRLFCAGLKDRRNKALVISIAAAVVRWLPLCWPRCPPTGGRPVVRDGSSCSFCRTARA